MNLTVRKLKTKNGIYDGEVDFYKHPHGQGILKGSLATYEGRFKLGKFVEGKKTAKDGAITYGKWVDWQLQKPYFRLLPSGESQYVDESGTIYSFSHEEGSVTVGDVRKPKDRPYSESAYFQSGKKESTFYKSNGTPFYKVREENNKVAFGAAIEGPMYIWRLSEGGGVETEYAGFGVGLIPKGFGMKDDYVGLFVNGRIDGFGVIEVDGKPAWWGLFKDRKLIGKVLFVDRKNQCFVFGDYDSASSRFEGQVREFSFTGARLIYDGTYKEGLRHGHGRFFMADGTSYEGDFLHGAVTGKGRAVYPGGDVYEGDFRDGRFHGKGVYHDKSHGSVFKGAFNADTGKNEGVYIDRHGNRTKVKQ